MALFGNLFGKKRGPKEAPASQAGPGALATFFPDGLDMSDWDQVFSACLGKMYTVQNRLGMQMLQVQRRGEMRHRLLRMQVRRM